MEILFENPIALIILIGVISSLFRKKNKDEKPKPQQTRPTQKSNRTFDELKEVFQEVSRSFQEETKPIRKFREEHSEQINEAKEKLESAYLDKDAERAIPQHEETNRVLLASKPQQQLQFKVDESKIVDAVIWSEILGPPRAKNPRHSNRIYKKY
ncbi:hypothetical protein [Niallia sp. Krafla_26]|uniref:hypothetical protein n=1 Tax=Niallia sp. Krafla_26 TaxID=3064703 RepID=UPI003D181077